MENTTIKTFTIDEANRLLPLISKRLEEISGLAQTIKNLGKDMEDLTSIWGRDISDPNNVDNGYYMEKVHARDTAVKQINETTNEINTLGCIVKDAENGLIDFYHDHGGELVLLCWRYGEKKVEYWHRLEGGFRGREHINTLK